MKSHFLEYGKKPNGRPPVADLTSADLNKIASLFLETNRTRKDGSIRLAWVRFCEENSNRLGHLVQNHMPITCIPTAVKEACRKARSSVGHKRGGLARLRHEGAYVPGTMRLTHDRSRRLYAGEQASVDDATRNVACWIPWPRGGCPCSDKFGVKLGRWQTLVVHDDASSFIPFFSSVFRVEQSYRGVDAASVIFQTERDVCMFDQWVIEGGVWQSKQALSVLAGRFISAKGRPNQKLVENFFGRAWTIIAGQRGDVGRHRGEIKAASDLYVKARQGQVDPRLHFMPLTQAQEAFVSSVQYLNEKEIRSQTYGVWVPGERWEADLKNNPRMKRNTADEFLLSPIIKKLKVRSHMIRTTADGPLGVPMVWTFTSDWLHQYEGRDISIHFDPLAEWPVKATVTLFNSRKPLGKVQCISAYGESQDRAADLVKAARQSVVIQTRNLASLETVTTIRQPEGTQTIHQTPGAETSTVDTRETTPARDAATPLQHDRNRPAMPPQAHREDLSNALARRAREAREANQL